MQLWVIRRVVRAAQRVSEHLLLQLVVLVLPDRVVGREVALQFQHQLAVAMQVVLVVAVVLVLIAPATEEIHSKSGDMVH
jgi:uncharacterized membrane protein